MLFALCATLSGVQAEDRGFSPQVWLNPGFYSFHFDRNRNFREDNVGVGAEFLFGADHGAMLGTFINSDNKRSRYGAYQWRPLHWRNNGINVSGALVIGLFDGYPRMRNGGWFIGAMPGLAIEGERFGANLSVVPTISNRVNGAVVVQFKLRVW